MHIQIRPRQQFFNLLLLGGAKLDLRRMSLRNRLPVALFPRLNARQQTAGCFIIGMAVYGDVSGDGVE